MYDLGNAGEGVGGRGWLHSYLPFYFRDRAFSISLACARPSHSIRSGNLLKVKLRRARLGKGGGGGGKNERESLLAFL